jgi:RHS repeat-associated protein
MAEQRQNTYGTPYRFNGKESDEETGLYYYGARYYDPRLSMWYGVDPLAEKYPGFSPYAYVYNNPLRFIDPTGMEGEESDGDFYSNKGVFIATDNRNDGKIYVLNSANEQNCSEMTCDQLKSKSTEVKLATIENKNKALLNWAAKYQKLSDRYSNDPKGNREFAMSLFTGKIRTSKGQIEVFASGSDAEGLFGVNGVSFYDSKSPIQGWSRAETIHTHRWGNDSGDFSYDKGYIPGDIQSAIKLNAILYLVVPHSNYIGSFSPHKYTQMINSGTNHEAAKNVSINKRALKIN